jgi:CDP-6-deoxy-D-xylo-4-hexulose-3-dehydrase
MGQCSGIRLRARAGITPSTHLRPRSVPPADWYAPNMFEAYGEEEISAVAACLRDGFLAPGPRTESFEQQVSTLFSKEYGIMVNSGSSANLIALNAFGFKPGDEVVTAACTFSTVIAPLEQLGVKPIFVDVHPSAYVPEVDAIIKAITPKTVMIWMPNLVGSKPDWKAIRSRTDLPLWEDSCDSITLTPETDVSMTSFYASHIITAGGGGGMIMANSTAFINKCRMYRDWGRIGNNSEDMVERFQSSVDGIPYDGKFLYGVVGYNMKSTEMNAAFGLEQLKKLPKFKTIRRANFDRFLSNLQGTSFVPPTELAGQTCCWLAFPLMHPRRNEVLKYLEDNNIQTRVTFAGNITRHPAYRHYLDKTSFPNADRIMAEGFLLGCHHGTTFAQVDRACELLKAFDKANPIA